MNLSSHKILTVAAVAALLLTGVGGASAASADAGAGYLAYEHFAGDGIDELEAVNGAAALTGGVGAGVGAGAAVYTGSTAVAVASGVGAVVLLG